MRLQLWILFLLIPILTACTECNWVTSKPISFPADTVWNTAYRVISKRYDIAKASFEKKEMETEWRDMMSIRYLEGYREKAFIKIEKYEKKHDPSDLTEPLQLDEDGNNEESKAKKDENEEKFIVNICVHQEQNRNIENPSVVSQAEWYYSGNNLGEAQLLISMINKRFSLLKLEKDVSKE